MPGGPSVVCMSPAPPPPRSAPFNADQYIYIRLYSLDGRVISFMVGNKSRLWTAIRNIYGLCALVPHDLETFNDSL